MQAFVDDESNLLSTITSTPYCPWRNGVEFVWAIAKKKYRNKLLLKKLDGLPIDNLDIVEESLNELPDH